MKETISKIKFEKKDEEFFRKLSLLLSEYDVTFFGEEDGAAWVAFSDNKGRQYKFNYNDKYKLRISKETILNKTF